jgi:fatty acid desaturase
MITIHREALLIAPAAIAVCFMLWFLVMLWRDEHRRHHTKRTSDRRIPLRDSASFYVTDGPSRYSGLK